VDSLNALDPKSPIREADIGSDLSLTGHALGFDTVRDEPFCVNSHDIPIFFGRTAMKPFLLACAAAIVVAAVAAVVLNRVQEPVERAFATTGVRL
jgi:hypothetical protein